MKVNLVVWKLDSGNRYCLTARDLADWRKHQSACFASEAEAKKFAASAGWKIAQTLVDDCRGKLACPADVEKRHGVDGHETLLGGGIAVRGNGLWIGYKLNWKGEYEEFGRNTRLSHLEAVAAGR